MVAGYLSSTFKWSRFNEKWGKLLRRHRVPIDPEHRVRVPHRNKIQHLKGPFAHWTEKTRDEFLEEACPIIRAHIILPIGNAVFREEFERIIPQGLQRVISGPYGWCVHSTLRSVKSWCEQNDYKKPINYVFEAGAPGYRKVSQVLLKMRDKPELRKEFHLGNIVFAGKELMPLHAADFIAYDLGRYALDVNLGRTRDDVHMYLRQLLGPTKPKEITVKFWEGPGLQKFVERLEFYYSRS